MTHRQQFWALETEEEVWQLAKQYYDNIRSQRWVIWEWKRRKAGTYELALQPRQPRLTREQKIINNFLMATSAEDILRMKRELQPEEEEEKGCVCFNCVDDEGNVLDVLVAESSRYV